ncbi:MAG TPA: FG-GAP-like repeat-containing protein [Stellaceae bacterium]|nr:FG-GAP-like repeat-containing protein [Stellaceae bacterium]
MAAFVVSNLDDSGAGSLRAAIAAANADTSGTPTVINFTVNGTITLASALPTITHTVTIDATSAPTYTAGGPPVVAFDFNHNAGLVFGAGSDGSQLLGVAIDNAGGNGVTLDAGAITLNNNYIGLDLSGAAAGNSGDGVFVAATSSNNLIGLNPTSNQGTTAAAGVVANVISGNGGNGISLHGSSGNTAVANRIGTDPTGMTAIANGGNGIWITDGSTGNTIGGTAYIDSTTGVANNPTGTEGGTTPSFLVPPLGNLVSGNGGNGILIDANSQNNVLSGNFVGTTADGNKPLGNALNGVWMNGADNNSLLGTPFLNPPGSPDPESLNRTPFTYYNVLSGNGGNGLQITNSNDITVQANFIGIGANDASIVGNKLNGVLVEGSSQNVTLGGPIPLGNVVSGNGLNGIDVTGTVSGFTTFNTFAGGFAFGGTATAANGNDGLLITSDDSSGAGPNIVQTNLFSGNVNNGIELAGNASGVVIEPNLVGLITAGDVPQPNGGDGLLITGTAHGNTVGGVVSSIVPPEIPQGEATPSVLSAQTFSGNSGYGIAIVGQAYDNVIQPFNFVGPVVGGIGPPTKPIVGNGAGGILLGGNAHDNTIGGDATPDDASGNTQNLISGNTGAGITILGSAANNTISSNKIGVDENGNPLPNTGVPILRYFGTGASSGTGSSAGTAMLVGQSVTPSAGSAFPQAGGELVVSQLTSGSLTQTVVPNAQMGAEWAAFGMADFNGDGNSDALWTNGAGGQAAIWELTGPTLSGFDIPTGKMGAEWQVAATGDFNGDGDADILWHAQSGTDVGEVAVWTMGGTQLVGFGISDGQIGVEWNPVATGDFYGTGRSGVLWENNLGQLQDWSLNGPDLNTLNNDVGQMGAEWRVAGVGHFNGIGNGDPTGDVVWVDTNNNVQVWQMTDGQIAQIVTLQGNIGTGWTLQGVGDYTGSGASQLLWTNSNGQNVIWQVNGAQVTVLSVNPGTQLVTAGQTVVNPIISNNTLQLASGAIVSGQITFASGGTGTLFDADQAAQPDTVVGFNEGTNHLKFAGQSTTTESAVIASSQLVDGNTVLTFPDHTSVVLTGVAHVDLGIFG